MRSRWTQLAACPAAATNLRAAGGKIGKLGYVKLAWDCGPADEIKIQRSTDGKKFLQIDAIPAAQREYEVLTSFNEWPETTIVEPSSSWSDPYSYLKILAEWKGAKFSPPTPRTRRD